MAQVVQFAVHPIGNHAPLVQQDGWRRLQFPLNAVAQWDAGIQPLAKAVQALAVRLQTQVLDRLNRLQCLHQLHHLARIHSAHSHLARYALQVANLVQQFLDAVPQVRLLEEVFHHVLSLHDGLHVLQRKHHPSPQHPRSHRTHRLVDDRQQAVTPLVHRAEQFEAPHRKLVHPHIAVLLYLTDAANVADVCVLCLLQIEQHRTSRHHPILQVFHAITLQVLCAEVGQEFLAGRLVGVNPVVQFEGEELAAEIAFKHRPLAALEQHLLRPEVRQEFIHIVRRTLRTEELTRRDVEQSHATGRLAEMHRCQKVVLLRVQHIIRQSHTRCDQFRDAPLHQFLRQFRVLQLVADGHPLASPDKFGQIGVQRMIGKPSHSRAAGRRASHTAPLRQRDAQNLGSHRSILVISLIEVATTKQQQRIRMFRLQVVKLPHHGCQLFFLRHRLMCLGYKVTIK